MPPKFNEAEFNEARGNAGSGAWQPPVGLYECKLKSISYQNHKAKPLREQAIFVWSVLDKEFAGKQIFQYQVIVDEHGKTNTVGLQILLKFCADCNYFPNFADFADSNKALQPLIDVTVILAVSQQTGNDKYLNFKVTRVISGVSNNTGLAEETNLSAQKFAVGDLVSIGMNADGNQISANIIFIGPDGSVVVERNGTKQTVTVDTILLLGSAATLANAQKGKEEDETIFNLPVKDAEPEIEVEAEAVEEEEIELKPGMKVNATYKGQPVSGPIHSLDEEKGIVWVTHGGKRYPCKPDSVSLVG